jgi:c-di-GMP-binding flagellar brake protein YcgR
LLIVSAVAVVEEVVVDLYRRQCISLTTPNNSLGVYNNAMTRLEAVVDSNVYSAMIVVVRDSKEQDLPIQSIELSDVTEIQDSELQTFTFKIES